jgi:carboxypeptidase C (cathepsin A)
VPPPAPAGLYLDPVAYSSAPGASLATADEIAAVTHRQLAIDGVTYSYTATAGHLTAQALVGGAPQASFFYVAYTLDNASPATRPVTFFYNGGPGSATVWLHLGSFAPVRLVTGMPSTSAPTPYPLIDNAESLLDLSDLVFVDAVGSGLSQAIAPNANRDFWNVDGDAAVFRDFVMRYLAANNRNASPRFLFGESYGTTRSAVLAHLLESAGMRLNGVILQSSALDYNTNCGITEDVASRCYGYLPSYGASGAWYNLANPNPAPAALPDFIAHTRSLASDLYRPALSGFLTMGAAPDGALLTQLANTTGLPVAKWQSHFNLFPGYFQNNLIPGTLVGRYDSRVSAPANSALARQGDPSSTVINSSFVSGIAGYLAGTLQYTNPSTYVTLSNAIDTWNFSHDGLALPDTIPDLAAALALNPRLKVFSANGYHDLATPFYGTELDLARLGANANVQVRFYSGGHMTYLDDTARRQQKADMAQFYRSAVAP